MTAESTFNPELFQFDPSQTYDWLVFPNTTLAIVTWNRKDYTEKLIDSLLRYTHLPHEFLIVDNGSTDGLQEWLRAFAADRANVRLILNRKNLGKARALVQVHEAVSDGLVVIFDNDVELLSNYWLLHVQKAFHAYRLKFGNTDVAFGVRLVNCDEYGFRFSRAREVLEIPTEKNAPPRTSYAAVSKDDSDEARAFDEAVVIGWTEFLTGNSVISLPAALFRNMPMEDQYPKFIGGVDSYFCRILAETGGRLAYIENGPVARHNDWPYSESKIEAYRTLIDRPAARAFYYLRWKIRNLLRRFCG